MKTHNRKRTRKGVVAVFVACILTGLIGVVALSIDGGLLYLELRKVRSTADAAAMAAESTVLVSSDLRRNPRPPSVAIPTKNPRITKASVVKMIT